MNKTTKRSRRYLIRKWADKQYWNRMSQLHEDMFRDSLMSPCTMVKFKEGEEPKLIPTGTDEWWDSYERLVHRETNPYKNERDEVDI